MSILVSEKVWRVSKQSGPHLLMLLAIADRADDSGRAFPSVETLAAKCRMKARNARIVLAALRHSGELEVDTGAGPHGTNVFRVTLSHLLQERAGGGQDSAGLQGPARGLQQRARGDARACTDPLQGVSVDTSVIHQDPSVVARKRNLAGFDANMIDLPEWLPPEKWADWVADRRERRKPITERAAKSQLHLLAKYRCEGHDVCAVIDNSIASGYQGLFAPRQATRSGLVAATVMSIEQCPTWAGRAGFANRFEAENAGCFEHNAGQFRLGHRETEAA